MSFFQLKTVSFKKKLDEGKITLAKRLSKPKYQLFAATFRQQQRSRRQVRSLKAVVEIPCKKIIELACGQFSALPTTYLSHPFWDLFSESKPGFLPTDK